MRNIIDTKLSNWYFNIFLLFQFISMLYILLDTTLVRLEGKKWDKKWNQKPVNMICIILIYITSVTLTERLIADAGS